LKRRFLDELKVIEEEEPMSYVTSAERLGRDAGRREGH
jgi:hypothetical protein